MFPEESMDILVALEQEEVKLQRQLKGIQGAIASLNGSHSASEMLTRTAMTRKRTLSAAARARISKATKKRWAKFRAEKAKKGK
jgi:hypothetical protein